MVWINCSICGLSQNCSHSEDEKVEFMQLQTRVVNELLKEAGIPTLESLAEKNQVLRQLLGEVEEILELVSREVLSENTRYYIVKTKAQALLARIRAAKEE
jgi:predicted RecB family nuclease